MAIARPLKLSDASAARAETERTHVRLPHEHAGLTALAICLGLGSGLAVRVIGDVFGAELIVLALLPVALLRTRQAPLKGPVRRFLVLGALWLISLIVTDLIRGSAPVDYLRGWAGVAIFMADLFVAYRLVFEQPTRRILLVAAFALGQIIGLIFTPTFNMLVDPWKFGMASPLALLALSLPAWWAVRRGGGFASLTVAIGTLAVLVVVNLLRGDRSEAGICGVAMAVVLLSRLLSRHRTAPAGRYRTAGVRAAILLLGAGAAGLLLLAGYSTAAQDGLLGADAQAKYFAQYHPGLAIIVGGRGEILVSGQAIADSPFLGHGSWAQDAKYVALAQTVRSEGYSVEYVAPDSPDPQLIPSHSHLFGAWVEAGILGAVFWVYALTLLARGFARMTAALAPMLPLCAYFSVHLIWDILFSPFSGSVRLFDAIGLVIIITVLWPSRLSTQAV